MEELNNRQLVLLTMFVSFVVSIATGIVTVAMLEEAPPTLTQTVNRVVEHTIERVTTGTTTETTKQPSIVTNVTKEVTVFAREDDLVVAAVAKNAPRMVKIFSAGTATSSDPKAIGFVISRDGIIVTDTHELIDGNTADTNYTVLIADKQYNAQGLIKQSGDEPIYFLKLTNLASSTSLDSVTFGRNENPKLAQTVSILGGADGEGVFKTSLSRFRYVKSTGTSTPEQSLGNIETNPTIPSHNLGGLVVNLDGQVIGIVIPDPLDITKSVIYPVPSILSLLNVFASSVN